MAVQIAIAGKGGTGKTTFTSLLLRYILENRKGKAVLAVDADANANLNEVLGLEVEETISSILSDTKNPKAVPTGMTKEMFVEYRLNKALVETEHLDLLVMGNPEGPGCYCYPNDLLRKHLEQLRENYDYVVIDNEAGLEHLSRRIVSNVDYLIITSDATVRGVRSAGRVFDIVKGVNIEVGNICLVVTKTRDSELGELRDEITKTGLELIGTVPYNEKVTEFDIKGYPLFELPEDNPAVQAVYSIALKLDL